MQPLVTRVSRTQTLFVIAPHVSLAMILNASGAGICDSHWTVMLVGQMITGGVVSSTVTVCWHVAKLLQASKIRQVRVAVNVLPHEAFVDVPTISTRLVPQASASRMGGSNVQGTVHSTVLLVGQIT